MILVDARALCDGYKEHKCNAACEIVLEVREIEFESATSGRLLECTTTSIHSKPNNWEVRTEGGACCPGCQKMRDEDIRKRIESSRKEQEEREAWFRKQNGV